MQSHRSLEDNSDGGEEERRSADPTGSLLSFCPVSPGSPNRFSQDHAYEQELILAMALGVEG